MEWLDGDPGYTKLRVRQASGTRTGSAYLYTAGGSQYNTSASTGNTQSFGGYNDDKIKLANWGVGDTEQSKDTNLWVYHPMNAANQRPYLHYSTWGKSPSNEWQNIQGFGYIDESTNWTGLHLYNNGGVSARWQVVVYGYKHA